MASQTEVSIQEFVSKQKQLLESELRAEEDNDNSTSSKDGGFILHNIGVINTSVGLYGRTVVSFGNTIQQPTTQSSDDNDKSIKESGTEVKLLLPAHRLTVGDEVQILPNNGRGFKVTKKSKAAGGVICACDDVSISVALFGADNNKVQQSKGSSKKKQEKKKDVDDNNEDEEDMLRGNPPYAMIPKSNIEVHNKMISSLDQLAKQGIRHPVAGDVVLAAFEPNTSKRNVELTSSRIETLESDLDLKSTKLDYSQRQAVVMALHSNSPINLIHGPPGTGKTTTVAELIRCAVHNMGWKVLVTAPSNVAVDNVLERVMSIEHEKQDSTCKRRGGSKKTNTSMKKVKAVRLGHPARIQHGIQKYSLESLVQSSEGTEIVQDCRSELNEHLKTLSNPKSRGQEKRVAYKEMKALKKEIRTREEKVVGEILRNSNVVLATNVGAASSLFNRMSDTKGEPISFDLVIIDEAAQALEASCWIPLLRGIRAVLAGDHKQLPPTIKCKVREVQQGLGRTLFERLMLAYDKNPNCRSKMLEVQYRMHKDISDWASEAMYNGKLISHDSVKDRQLSTLPVVSERMATQTEKDEGSADELDKVTMMLIDTTGCDMHETANAGSRYNEGEANIVVSHVHSLIKLGLRAQDIAVITPYNGQVELLRKLLLPDIPKLEIRSVDGFQGGEREAVVLSLVRSSEKGGQDGIGFLSDERRLNVAITRAKRHVAVICDCETVSKNKFIKGLIDWLEVKAEHRSGAEYNIDDTIISSESLQAKISLIIEKPQKQSIDNNKQNNPKKSSKKQPNTNNKNTFPKTDKMEYSRAELMQRITLFSQQGKQGQALNLSLNSEYDCVIAKELAAQLGLGCCDNDGTNKLVLSIIKETKAVKPSTAVQPATKDKEPAVTSSITTSKFAQLDMDDDSSVSSVEESKSANTPNNLLRELALEREKRQSQQPKAPPPPEDKPSIPSSKKKKSKKKGNNKKAKAKKEDKDDQFDDLDDLAFLDAQIDKVQNSHGRKIEAKGKGYRSIVNGVLLSTPQGQTAPKKNKAASCSLQDKLKAKAKDRTAKKKKK